MIENYLFHLPAIFFDINDFMELSPIFSQSFGLEIEDFTIVFVSVQNVNKVTSSFSAVDLAAIFKFRKQNPLSLLKNPLLSPTLDVWGILLNFCQSKFCFVSALVEYFRPDIE